MFPCGVCGEDMGDHPVGGPCPRDMPQAKHPRIDDALAQLRLQYPTMPAAEKLAEIFAQKQPKHATHAAMQLADGSQWAIVAIDLDRDTLKLWHMR